MFDSITSTRPELNPRQQEAVALRGAPVLVVAGAGSGKTKTLACRVAHLVDEGVAPERILLLTFSRRAAQEMLRRAALATARDGLGQVWGGTFHAIACRLLRSHGTAVGVPPAFTVMDQGDGADMMNLVRAELRLDRSEKRFPRKDTLAAIYSRTVNAQTKLSEVLDRWFPWCRADFEPIGDLFRLYVERKQSQGVLDYDDLLLYWYALVASPETGPRIAEMFDHILVDEYQDTNALQAEIVRYMCQASAEVMVVGDDAQAIYSFRSATVQNMLDFPSRHPGAVVVKLERNYRSTRAILAASNAVIAESPQRFSKELWTDRDEGAKPALVTCEDEGDQSTAVCRRILDARERGVDLRSQAVLFRAGHHSSALEVELARRNIPFVKYGGLKFMESAHVKDVVALLRILENPADEMGWFRVLQLLDGVGPGAARRIMGSLRVGGHGDDSPLRRLVHESPTVPARAAADFDALRALVADCARDPALEVPAEIERVRRFLEPILGRIYSAAGSRLRDIERLEQIATRYASRARLLSDLALDPPKSTADLAGRPLLDDDYLVLSTIHSAKGCEWDVVYVLHASDGMIPSDMALTDEEGLEEERRLFYVAMTRARDEVHVMFPRRYYLRPNGLGDAHGYAQLTRFLPEKVRRHFEEATEGVAQREEPAAPVAASSSVARSLEHLWS
jgi:DNA helicase II / ATP-dependent DNA helicase PcrA